jgi:hypothetical protein
MPGCWNNVLNFPLAIDDDIFDQISTFEALEGLMRIFEHLIKCSVKIYQCDFFKVEKSQAAVFAIRDCRQKLCDYTRQVYAQYRFASTMN